MSATPTAPTPATTPKFDKAVAASKLKEIKTYLETFQGKPGFNPHFLLVQSISPLEAALADENPLTEKTFNAIMALKKIEPVIDVRAANQVKH